MKIDAMRRAAVGTLLFLASTGLSGDLQAGTAQHWAAASKVSMSITGDIAVSQSKIVFGDKAALKLSFIGIATRMNNAPEGKGQPVQLYRVANPHELKLRNGNSICRATYLTLFEPVPKPDQPGDLYVAFFTGAASPTPKDFEARMCDAPYWYVAALQPRIQAGFDCAKAASPVETSICADASVAERDRLVSLIYTHLLRAKPDQSDSLHNEQRVFLAERKSCRARERGLPPSKPALNNCIWDLTTARLDELGRRAKAAGLGQKLDLKSVEPAWEVFKASAPDNHGPICMIRSGHDGSDALQVIRQPGKATPITVQYEEFAYEGVGVLREGDSVGFEVDDQSFPGNVALSSPARDPARTFRIVVPAERTAALLKSMESGEMMRVMRNAKVIFLAPLEGFGLNFEKAGRECAR